MPQLTRQSDRVAILLYDGVCAFEFSIANEVLARTRPHGVASWYTVQTCAERGEVISSTPGLRFVADRSLEELEAAGTIVIAGWTWQTPEPSPSLRRSLLRAHAGGARLVSICTGAFLLAELGVFGGRTAATHWLYADAFRDRYPHIALQTDRLYVDNGDVMSSAGSAAGLDVLLHMIAKDFGAAASNEVARRLVVQPHRTGGQQQFIETPMPSASGHSISPLLDRIRGSLSRDWRIETMADEVAMSPRTVARRFEDAIGMSPGRWLLQERVRAAKVLLETSRCGLDDIAASVGLGSPENLVRRFRAQVGLTPAAYRQAFRRTGATPGPTRPESVTGAD